MIFFNPFGCMFVEVSRDDLLVIQRHYNPQHLASATDKSPVGYRFATTLSVFANAPDRPIFQNVTDSVGGDAGVELIT